ncbi:hypothetical protein TNCV_4392031 [Trichonephila clavipes]|nr:hypothetical protein TNCV_4392031 [Trichonephila clavipes]
MVAKGFGGKNFPILNKGNQVARCEGEIGVPKRGPRAVKVYASRFAGGSITVVRGTTTEAHKSLSIGAMIPCVAQSTTSRALHDRYKCFNSNSQNLDKDNRDL